MDKSGLLSSRLPFRRSIGNNVREGFKNQFNYFCGILHKDHPIPLFEENNYFFSKKWFCPKIIYMPWNGFCMIWEIYLGIFDTSTKMTTCGQHPNRMSSLLFYKNNSSLKSGHYFCHFFLLLFYRYFPFFPVFTKNPQNLNVNSC